jgi:hypothetical protein
MLVFEASFMRSVALYDDGVASTLPKSLCSYRKLQKEHETNLE